MSVLVHSMQTDKLHTAVQCYYHGDTTQDCWKEILQVAQYFGVYEFKSLHTKLMNLQFKDWPSDLVSFLLFWNDLMTQLGRLQPVTQQHLSCEVKKSLLVAAVHSHPILAEVDKLDQDLIIHCQKPMSSAQFLISVLFNMR